MADFIDSEAEESEEEEELEPHEKKKLKRIKAMDSSDEDEEDDEEKIREELKDLIDDAPIEEESDGDDSDASRGSKKRKKSDEEFDDRLEDEDYDLIEENLGVKVERRKFKRLRRIQDEESDGDEGGDESQDKEAIANDLFEGRSDDDEERRSERAGRPEPEVNYDDEVSEGESDADDFIVDDDGRPIAEKKKKRKPIFTDAALQEAQDIFGVDFDYEEFDKYEDDYEEEEEEEDEYLDEEVGDSERKRPKKAARKKTTRKTIFEIYEPSELKRGHFTDFDNTVRNADIPERMQLRDVPITPVPEGSNELEEEAAWIYQHAFLHPTVSDQQICEKTRNTTQTINKIRQALDLMRNYEFEVPFIGFYRKEYVQPELNMDSLWRVYKYDAKWCQLRERKQTLLSLYEKMQSYQLDKITEKPNEPIPDNMRVIKDEDLERLKNVQSAEELKDVHRHFLLYYADDIPEMQAAWEKSEKEKAKAEKRRERLKKMEQEGEDGAEIIDDTNEEIEAPEEPAKQDTLKQAVRSGPYEMCRKAGLGTLAKRFGLTPEQFASNLHDNYQRHDVDQEPVEPLELCKEFIKAQFKTPDEVLIGAKYMVAMQLARDPVVRKCIREAYFERAKINIRPTKKGFKEIDENHACYSMKYLKNKPVRQLTGDQYLKLVIAEEEKLLEIEFIENIEGNRSSSYIDEAKQLYIRDEFSKNVQEWNAVRTECVERAINKIVIPELIKELRRILLTEAKDFVLRQCSRKIYDWLKVGPYQIEFPDEDDEDWDTSKGIRVMAVAYVPDQTQSAFTCIVTPDGDVSDYLRLPHLTKRRKSFFEEEKVLKESDLLSLKNFILSKKPHVICVGGESRDAIMIASDIKDIVSTLMEEEQFPAINVEIAHNELAKVYANSVKGETDFREYPELLRQAISLGRRMQDPLIEFSQLCTPDDEILCLRYHPMQEYITPENLLDAITIEFVNRVNEVGVDINRAVNQNHTANLVQFICGLGPRKGQALLKILKQSNQRLENRTQLVTACHMGPKVFINCSGFVKIDTNSLGDSTEAYVEVLDGSRVHPETYEWARKMAVDALEYDDEDANPAGALEEILDAPERLKDLDLDAFAEELERQGFGNKSITLYDIRSELNSRYKDLRPHFESPNPEEMFDMLTKESPQTFYIGKLVTATVVGISRKKPQGEQLDQANPVRNDETGLWQCPFCLKNDFPELSEVWNHFDAGACPGQATGIRLRLDNGISGYIHIKNISDKHVANPEERVKVGQLIHCRVIKMDVERFSVDCSSKSSDLLDKVNKWRPPKDDYYDADQDEKEIQDESDKTKNKRRQTYVKRVIVHPSFHNISYAEAEKIMEQMDQGECIVRPSSKGTDHLTITWKVADKIYQHIDVREEGKENAFSLGQSLWIGNEEFEDLDEIIARHVYPMAAFARDLYAFKYYRDTEGGLKDKAEELLKEEKKKNPSKIHYFISVAKSYPGKFLLSYLPRAKCRHEYVTITPDGFRFRQQVFETVGSLFKWFKEHFRDPIPGTPQTPRSIQTGRSPYTNVNTPNISGMNPEAIHRVAQNLPSHMIQSLSAVASQTPHHYPHTPGGGAGGSYGYGNINTPYTPSGQTPFITPYHTPRYGQQTPGNHTAYGSMGPPPMMPPGHRGPSTSYMHHPGTPTSYMQQSSYPNARQSPRMTGTPRDLGYRNNPSKDPMDWQKAAEAWASRSKKHPDMDGRKTPRGTPNSYSGQRTPRDYDMEGRPSSRKGGLMTPRSGRSTPRTIASPRSMSLGDATPLYDEN